jgi:2-oxoisovalerate dehydrogenase E1 component
LPIGKAVSLQEGNDVTIITYGAGVHWALETLEKNPTISADLIDLRTLQPLDKEAIYASVKKTGKVLLLTEDAGFGSVMSDISAMITEACFEFLDAPIRRVTSIDTPIPFAEQLEEQYLSRTRLEERLKELLAY